MQQAETLVEGRPSLLKLDREAATRLAEVGRQLASKKEWWGLDAPPEERTVITCREMEPGAWEVTVRDAVGLVSLGDLQLLVEPKIPREHLLYLFSKSGGVPRLTEDKGWINAGQDLWELIATWYLRATEYVLRRDLVRDYLQLSDELAVVRGQVEAVATARDYYRGKLALHCDFEEMGTDTPLNRVLRAAARVVARSTDLAWDVRRRAMRVLARMDDIGELRSSDLRVGTDRRTAHCRDALALARHILRGERRTLENGTRDAWTFLIRTPEMVESGLRQALSERLPGRQVKLGTISLPGTTMTANPDLVFDGGLAVADVKYKLSGKDWRRPDLYQAVAFAAAVRTEHAAIIGFAPEEPVSEPHVYFGDISVRAIDWIADSSAPPESAADELAQRIEVWLNSCPAD